jgi:putrescine aminotransferase
VVEIRLQGFIGAIELVKDKKTRQPYQPVGEIGTICRDHCFAIGLVMRATRDTMPDLPAPLPDQDRDRRVRRLRPAGRWISLWRM